MDELPRNWNSFWITFFSIPFVLYGILSDYFKIEMEDLILENSYSREKKEEYIWERGCEEGAGSSGGRRNCGQDILFERSIFLVKIKKINARMIIYSCQFLLWMLFSSSVDHIYWYYPVFSHVWFWIIKFCLRNMYSWKLISINVYS